MPTAEPPPLPLKTKSHFALRGFLIATALVAAGAGLWLLRREIKREDTPERFARLSLLLLPELEADGARSIKATDAEQRFKMDKRRAGLLALSRECRDLAPIARTTEAELGRALSLAEAAPAASGILLSGVETAVGYSLRSSEMMESGSKGLLDLAKNYVALFQEMSAIRTTIETQRIALFELAPRFSAAPTAAPVLSVQMAEEKPFLLNRILDGDQHSMKGTQTLTLVNESGRTLSACVLSVRFVEADGDSYRHFYSIPAWLAGERRVVRYTPGGPFTETSTDVNRVQVQVYATELSSPLAELTRKGAAWPYVD